MGSFSVSFVIGPGNIWITYFGVDYALWVLNFLFRVFGDMILEIPLFVVHGEMKFFIVGSGLFYGVFRGREIIESLEGLSESFDVWSLVRFNVSLWVLVTSSFCNYSPGLILLDLGLFLLSAPFCGFRFFICLYILSFSLNKS